MNLHFSLYRLLSKTISPAIGVFSLFNSRAQQWINGRKNWRSELSSVQEKLRPGCLWIHAASLGEYEMARPLIRAYGDRYPDKSILVSFFSPSGYEHAKLESLCHKIYLPADTPANARFLIETIKPGLIVFAKYDLWFNLIHAAEKGGISTAVMGYSPDEKKLNWPFYGKILIQSLQSQWHIFTIDEKSLQVLLKKDLENVTVGGDPRYLNVRQNASNAPSLPVLEEFSKRFSTVIVAGSVWMEDMAILRHFVGRNKGIGWIIAPHDVSPANVKKICELLPSNFSLYSRLKQGEDAGESDTVVLDGIGTLATAYRYADISYVGGAFNKGLHNIVEAAAFGSPVLFGPNYQRFPEAFDFIREGLGASVSTPKEFEEVLTQYNQGNRFRSKKDILDFIYRKAEQTKNMYSTLLNKFKQLNEAE